MNVIPVDVNNTEQIHATAWTRGWPRGGTPGCGMRPSSTPVNILKLYTYLLTYLLTYWLYAFFWVIPRQLNFICRRFGTLCLFHLHRQVGVKND